jgi:hypothetical protein
LNADELLREIGVVAYDRASALDAKRQTLTLFEAATPFDGVVRWTEYMGGVRHTTGGALREAALPELGAQMLRYAKRVEPKGGGWWFTGAVSKNGGCRDADIALVTMLILDADGAGEWDAARELLHEAGLAYIAQRSSSHTPSVPKWHLLIPLAQPWSGPKHEWRCIWRFLVAWMSAAAKLRSDVAADPPVYGFDPKTDRLGQPSFPAAKRTVADVPRETLVVTGNALDLDAFLDGAGFDRSWFQAATHEPASADAVRCSPEHGLVALAFSEAGMLGHRIDRGDAKGFAVVCPTGHLHSGPRRSRDDSTIIFDPLPGSTKGYFHCKHRCGDRKPDEVLKLLPPEAVERARIRWRAAHRPKESTDAARRPKIVLSPEEQEINDDAVAALALHPNVFQRGGFLVHVVVDPRTNAPRITPIALATLRELLADSVDWRQLKATKDKDVLEEVPVHPPDWCVKAVHAREVWTGVRPLAGVVETPALRPDGSVLQTPGYDDATCLLYRPTAEFPLIPDAPTLADAKEALAQLLEVVVDFPFAGEAHRAAWVATVLTLLARAAIQGCIPMAAFDASTRGTGKGKLVDATSNIVFGRDACKMPQPKNDDEMRKRITALLLEGERLIVLDNIARPLGDPSLDACLTATEWKDRLLSTNITITTPNLALWIATGNNLQFDGDTARRAFHVRLESDLENPEHRENFRHAELLTWVRRERSRLVVAALTVLRAYFVAGSPDMGCKPWGSFEAWTRLIANGLVWAGMADPQATRLQLEAEADTGRQALYGLLRGWKQMQDVCGLPPTAGFTIGQVVRTLYPAPTREPRPPEPPGYVEFRDALEAMVSPSAPGKPPSAQKLGMHLHHARHRIVGGMMFDRVGVDQAGAKWRVQSAGNDQSSLSDAERFDAEERDAIRKEADRSHAA